MRFLNPRYCYIFKNRLAPYKSVVQANNGPVAYTFDKPFEAPVAVIRFFSRRRLARELAKHAEYKGLFAYIYERKFNRPSRSFLDKKKNIHIFDKPFSIPLEKFVI